MTVQPTGLDNVSSSVLLDLPNINTNLPPPLLPNPSPHHHQINQTEVTNPGQVTNSEILKSIQSITEVIQTTTLLNSKDNRTRHCADGQPFPGNDKGTRKKETWILHYSRYPHSREKLLTDHDVWTWCQESKMCVTSQGAHFIRNSLINQAFWFRILFEVLMRESLTMSSQRKFYSSSLMF